MNVEMNKTHKLIIIGSGPAGYTASIYASRANLNPILITGPLQGGQLINTNQIENWPSQIDSISGFDLMNKFYKQSIKFKTNIIIDNIKKVFLKKKPIVLIGKNIYLTKTLIIATGSNPRYLGLESEKKFMGNGISTCAVCDGFFYKNKKVAVVGGGNTAIEETMYLSKIVKKVYLIHRRNYFKAEKILMNKLLNKNKYKNVKIFTNFIIKNIIGDDVSMNSIEIQSTINKKLHKIINVSGLFIAIGHDPNTNLFVKQLKTNNGYIEINRGIHNNMTATSIPGVFAAGDVIDHTYKQAITASAYGCMAAIDVEKYLNSLKN